MIWVISQSGSRRCFFRLELSISDGMSGHAIAKLGLVVARVSEWFVNNPSRCTGGGGQHAK